MKKIFLIILLTLTITSNLFSQKTIDDIKGDWICLKVADSYGNHAAGKYEGYEYLRFSIEKTKLTISMTPFNRGSGIPINFGKNYFELSTSLNIPEKRYDIDLVEPDSMILSTSGSNGIIKYHFSRQNKFWTENKYDSASINTATLLIKHLKSDNGSRIVLRIGNIELNQTSTNPFIPTYSDQKFPSLENYLANSINLPKDYTVGTKSEIIIDCDIIEGKLKNIELIESNNSQVEQSIIKAIERTSGKWSSVTSLGGPIKVKIRFKVIIALLPAMRLPSGKYVPLILLPN